MERAFARLASLSAMTLCAAVAACGSSDSGDGEQPVARSSAPLSPPASSFSATFARQWMTNIAFSVKYDNITPPVAARSYAYGAIAAYEAVVYGMPGNVSLAGQINGLSSLPIPDTSLTYDWPTVLAATMGRVVNATYVFPDRIFYEFTTPTHVSLGSMEAVQIAQRRVSGVPAAVIVNSTEFGHVLGDAIAAWANADGYAQARYAAYVPPVGPSAWVQTGYVDDQTKRPVEPHFGDLRTLALANAGVCLPPPPVPFSTDPASAMYAEANTVLQTDLNLTKSQRETAFYWADGAGSETPPGHWIKIVNDLVRPRTLPDAVQAYLPVAVSMFDDVVATWNAKYHYNLLRPETYIHRNIQAQWRSLLPTPQFPSYTSGHSGFSTAAATALTTVFGSGPFTDKTKVRGGFDARTYPNFFAAADEAGLSRIYGGIHYPMDNVQGKFIGTCAANAFTARVVLHP